MLTVFILWWLSAVSHKTEVLLLSLLKNRIVSMNFTGYHQNLRHYTIFCQILPFIIILLSYILCWYCAYFKITINIWYWGGELPGTPWWTNNQDCSKMYLDWKTSLYLHFLPTLHFVQLLLQRKYQLDWQQVTHAVTLILSTFSDNCPASR